MSIAYLCQEDWYIWKYFSSRFKAILVSPLTPSPPLPSSCFTSLCKGRTLYSVVRDAKVVLDVNKTRQIAQEMVKVKSTQRTDSHDYFKCSQSYFRAMTSFSAHRGWATSMPRGFYTKTLSPKMSFTTTAKLSSPTLDSSPYLGSCRLECKCNEQITSSPHCTKLCFAAEDACVAILICSVHTKN